MSCRRVLGAIAALLVVTFGLVDAGTVSAHTGFASSSPAEGDVVATPVGVVTLVFTGAPTSIEDGFAALGADGIVREPVAVANPAPGTFDVTFDPPLAGGDIGVRWAVQAADGHVLEGGFAFTVDAPAPTAVAPTTVAPTTMPPTTSAPQSEPIATSVAPQTDAVAPTSTALATAGATDSATPTSTAAEELGAASATDATTTLDDFLADAEDGDVAGSGRSLLGRLLGIPATAVLVGGLAVLAWVYVGSAGGISAGVRTVRLAAALLAVGAVLEFLGSIAASGEQWSSAFTSGTERAMALRFVGAVVVIAGIRFAIVSEPRVRSLSAATATLADASTRIGSVHRLRWNPRPSLPMLLGVVAVVVSYWFDGHTVTRGWAPLHAMVNSVHLVAGSVWFAGVVLLALVAGQRRRRDGSVSVAELMLRFSPIATVVSVAVVIAGVVMAVMVLDAPSEIWSTPWGRTLLAKSAAVSVAAALGAYNHFVLTPAFDASPDDQQLVARLRSVVTVEAVTICAVLLITVWLVAART